MQKYYRVAKENPLVLGLKTSDTSIQFAYDLLDSEQKKTYDLLSNAHLLEQIPEVDFKLDKLKMRKGAKLLDFMFYDSALMTGKFLVSAKAKQLLENFVLPEHQFYKVDLLDAENKSIEGYYLFYHLFYDKYTEAHVDWTRTIFYQQGKFNRLEDRKEFTLNSILDVRNWIEDCKLKGIAILGCGCKILVLKKSFPCPDFANIRAFFTHDIISDRLRKTIINEGLTGLIFEDLNEKPRGKYATPAPCPCSCLHEQHPR